MSDSTPSNPLQLTPIKPGRSIGKKSSSRKFLISVFSSSERELRLNFVSCSLGLRPGSKSPGSGVRLNTYSDSIGPVWSRIHETLNPTGPSSAAIPAQAGPQHGSGNSQQYTQRLSIQIEGGFRVTGRCRQVRESSFLRTCHWGGCSKMVLTFRGYAMDEDFSLPIHEADVHLARMEVDSTVVFGGRGVILHSV